MLSAVSSAAVPLLFAVSGVRDDGANSAYSTLPPHPGMPATKPNACAPINMQKDFGYGLVAGTVVASWLV